MRESIDHLGLETGRGGGALSRRLLLLGGAAAALAVPVSTLLDPVSPASAQPRRTGSSPVPPGAQGPAIPASGYLVQEIGRDLYWITDGLYQMVFLVTDEGVVAVDAPPTIGTNILRGIKSVTSRRVRHVIFSHHHADHVGATTLYGDAKGYAHEDTARLLARLRDPNRPVPRRTFSDSKTLKIGGERIELAYHGPNHSPGNAFVHFPEQEVLMLVDVVFPGWVPFASLAESQDIPGWLEAADRALDYPFTTLVGGHLTRLGTRDDVTLHSEYVADLRTEAERAIDGFDPTPIFSQVDPTNPWAVFDAYLEALARQAADAVTPRWVDRLGGADVFTKSSAFSMVESLRIDTGRLGPFGIRP